MYVYTLYQQRSPSEWGWNEHLHSHKRGKKICSKKSAVQEASAQFFSFQMCFLQMLCFVWKIIITVALFLERADVIGQSTNQPINQSINQFCLSLYTKIIISLFCSRSELTSSQSINQFPFPCMKNIEIMVVFSKRADDYINQSVNQSVFYMKNNIIIIVLVSDR